MVSDAFRLCNWRWAACRECDFFDVGSSNKMPRSLSSFQSGRCFNLESKSKPLSVRISAGNILPFCVFASVAASSSSSSAGISFNIFLSLSCLGFGRVFNILSTVKDAFLLCKVRWALLSEADFFEVGSSKSMPRSLSSFQSGLCFNLSVSDRPCATSSSFGAVGSGSSDHATVSNWYPPGVNDRLCVVSMPRACCDAEAVLMPLGVDSDILWCCKR
mmetsp:Transcript_46085/g.73847  ORF Transcript_46085/g.73847 Transcript_46085/m.73847 type:complete len:217 (+) Transcript_46085:3378-4028(+)